MTDDKYQQKRNAVSEFLWALWPQGCFQNIIQLKLLVIRNTRNCQEKVKKISHLKPNQLAPSIYIMKELCFFSLDQ